FWRRATELLAAVWLATLALWWWTSRPVKKRREPEQVPVHKQQSRILKNARKAAVAGDAGSVRAALLEWGRMEWPVDPPLSVGDFANRVNSPLADELMQLSRSSYGPEGASWSGDALASALKSFKTLESMASNDSEVLPPLTPGMRT
ncbi:MAG: hypothetical protein AAF351_15565, partial [Pseudomonadota bacterium]